MDNLVYDSQTMTPSKWNLHKYSF